MPFERDNRVVLAPRWGLGARPWRQFSTAARLILSHEGSFR